MRDFVARLLMLALISLNSYAGPLNLRPGIRNRPDIGAGERGSIVQEAMGSPQDQFSPINPSSNQAVFVRNTFLLPQQNGNNSNSNGRMTFKPQSSLPASEANIPLDAMTKRLLDSNGDISMANRVTPTPFASKVAKSQIQGMAFVRAGNSFSKSREAISSTQYLAGLGYAITAILSYKMHKDNPSLVPIGTPTGLVLPIPQAATQSSTLQMKNAAFMRGGPQADVGSPLIMDHSGPVQFNGEDVDVYTSPIRNQKVGGTAGTGGNGLPDTVPKSAFPTSTAIAP